MTEGESVESRSLEQALDIDVAAHNRRLDVLGYTMIPGFLDPDRAEGLRSRAIELHAEVKATPGRAAPRPELEGVVPNLQNYDRMFIDILSDVRLEALLMPRLNDPYYAPIPADAPNYILGELIARSSTKALPLHLDSWMPAAGNQTWMVQVVFALEDRDEAEGCSVVVPGSHQSGSYPDRQLETVHPVPVRTGDLVIWDSRLWHASRDRTSARPGWIVLATFQRWWVKPRFDIPGGVPDAIYASLSDRQKALLGYCSVPPLDDTHGPKQGYEWADRNRLAMGRRAR